ncbi:hypothetical protein MALG_01830 [Marinovum algicola DG 898]|nr:hypothetical protein MALG_01830 [Marinovum algicola DG 898]
MFRKVPHSLAVVYLFFVVITNLYWYPCLRRWSRLEKTPSFRDNSS